MSVISLEIRGVEELVAKLDTLQKFNYVRSVISQQGVFLQRQLRKYPRAVHAPNPLIRSDSRVRRGFFYHLKQGDIRVPYKRTRRLGQSWTSYSSVNGFTVTVENNMPYAPLVQGWEDQVTQHKWSGWLTDKGAINLYGKQIEAKIMAAIEKRWQMSELYRIKIQVPEGIIEREDDTEKRMKADGDYVETGWRVLGVPFGGPIDGRDLDGEAFTPETDIWLKVGDKVNLTYYHGFDPDKIGEKQANPALIGRATYVGADERGHWFEPVLDIEEPLAQRLMKAEITELRASSGAINHLVRKDAGGLISVWPVGELALFDINEWRRPANDFAVIEAKTEKIAEAIPEADESAVDAVEESVEAESKSNSIIPMEENTMDEEKIVEEVKAEEPKVDIKAIADEIRKSIIEELKSEPGLERGERTVKAPAVIDGLGEKSYKSAFWNYVRTGEESDIRKAAKAALQEGTTTEGGYLVPDDEYGSIIAKRDEESIISKLGLMRVTTNRDKYNFPTENASLAKFTLVAEEGPISAAEEEPTFAQVAVPIYKFTKLILVSEELLEDENSNLEAFLTNAIGRAVADTENYYTLIGAGTTQPQGAFVGGTAGLTLDSASAIGAGEIPKLMGKLGSPYHNGAAWVMDPATWFYLKGLTSSNVFTFTSGVARLSGTVDGPTLEGYPVILNSNAAGVTASAKSLLFGNFNYMGFVTNRGLRVKRLNELYAGNGQVGILATYRFGCEVLQAEAFQYATHPSA